MVTGGGPAVGVVVDVAGVVQLVCITVSIVG